MPRPNLIRPPNRNLIRLLNQNQIRQMVLAEEAEEAGQKANEGLGPLVRLPDSGLVVHGKFEKPLRAGEEADGGEE